MKQSGLSILITFGLVVSQSWGQSTEMKDGRIHGVMPEKHFGVLDNYCLNCHDSVGEKGGVNLEELSFTMNTIQSAELWQKVLNAVIKVRKKKNMNYEGIVVLFD